MKHATLARRAVRDTLKDAALQTVGFASPLYGAVLRARFGRDPAGEVFAALMARLPIEEQDRFWDCVNKLDATGIDGEALAHVAKL